MGAEIAHWRVEPLVRNQRSWDERMLLRSPTLARRTLDLALRMPASSRLRRLLVTRSILGGIAANNRGDYEVMGILFHPEVMVRTTEGRRPPGLEAEHVGKDGYFRLLDVWKEPFDGHRFETRELFDGGDRRIGAQVDVVGRGHASGVEIRQPDFHVWELERGLLRRQWITPLRTDMFELLSGSVPSSLC